MLDLLTLGRTIAARRKALRLTQKALAAQARIGRVTLDRLENGRSGELGFSKIMRLMVALGLDLEVSESAPRPPTLEELLADDTD